MIKDDILVGFLNFQFKDCIGVQVLERGELVFVFDLTKVQELRKELIVRFLVASCGGLVFVLLFCYQLKVEFFLFLFFLFLLFLFVLFFSLLLLIMFFLIMFFIFLLFFFFL